MFPYCQFMMLDSHLYPSLYNTGASKQIIFIFFNFRFLLFHSFFFSFVLILISLFLFSFSFLLFSFIFSFSLSFFLLCFFAAFFISIFLFVIKRVKLSEILNIEYQCEKGTHFQIQNETKRHLSEACSMIWFGIVKYVLVWLGLVWF